ncbi:hypothetical protein KIN20_015658 [Parelaphostrongylus tenuis]|uniref:Uncharacterized protein n=1 Tax=Parelaphostrongylus tenuis TaxID=148309 RepID=A0AAD5N0K5_PARTN|nr:hypothetical protein KIN20_015658 [Parelaphostrongylus tenuis]
MHKNRRIGSGDVNDPHITPRDTQEVQGIGFGAQPMMNPNDAVGSGARVREFGSGVQPEFTMSPDRGIGSGVVSGHDCNPKHGIGSGTSPNYAQNTCGFGCGAQPGFTGYPDGHIGSGAVSGHDMNQRHGIGSGASPNYAQETREFGSGAQPMPTIHPSSGIGSGAMGERGFNPGYGIGSGTAPNYSQVNFRLHERNYPSTVEFVQFYASCGSRSSYKTSDLSCSECTLQT